MSFTHLVDNAIGAGQELRQNFEHYILIVGLTDEAADFVRRISGEDLESAPNTLCWVITSKQLSQAVPSSTLGKIYAATRLEAIHPDTNHSFLAAISKTELLQDNPVNNHYVFLELEDFRDSEKTIAVLKDAVRSALIRSSAKSDPTPPQQLLNNIVSAWEFVRQMIELLGK
jgi:hypothetical protein